MQELPMKYVAQCFLQPRRHYGGEKETKRESQRNQKKEHKRIVLHYIRKETTANSSRKVAGCFTVS